MARYDFWSPAAFAHGRVDDVYPLFLCGGAGYFQLYSAPAHGGGGALPRYEPTAREPDVGFLRAFNRATGCAACLNDRRAVVWNVGRRQRYLRPAGATTAGGPAEGGFDGGSGGAFSWVWGADAPAPPADGAPEFDLFDEPRRGGEPRRPTSSPQQRRPPPPPAWPAAAPSDARNVGYAAFTARHFSLLESYALEFLAPQV